MNVAKKAYLREDEWEKSETYTGDYQSVKVELNDEDWDSFDEFISESNSAWELTRELREGGYKLSISYSGKSGSNFVSLSCTRRELCNAGKTLTIECLDVEKGMQALAYAHYVVYREVWPIRSGRKNLRF